MTLNTVPDNNSTFFNDLQTFLQEEDADRFRNSFSGHIISGGIHGTGASLSQTPSALTAFPGGHYISETGSITYPDDTTHIWVLCHKDTTTAVTDWTRVSGTHYMYRNTGSATRPSLPSVETALLMKVTTASGSVTAVEDARILSPIGNISTVTDNAIPRFDGTSGLPLQNSGIIIDDSDNISGIANITLTGTVDGRDVATDGTKLDTIETSADITDWTNVAAALAAPTTPFIFNESAADQDFRVESTSNTHMFFVDAGNNSVHIDNSLLTGAGDGDLVLANTKYLRWINSAGTTSANYGISSTADNDMRFDVPASTDFYLMYFNNTVRAGFQEEASGFGIAWTNVSSSDHTAPSSGGTVLYTTDTGGGKTQLVARFATGAVQVIATEP